MHIADFFGYKDLCPVCNKELLAGGQIDILVESTNDFSDDFSVAGYIIYDFYNKKFHKSQDKVGIGASSRKFKPLMNTLHRNFPETFTLNNRFRPRISKRKISPFIKPWLFNSIYLHLFKTCTGKEHFYHYVSGAIFEEEAGDGVDMGMETLMVKGFNIRNIFFRNNPERTEIFTNKDEHFNLPPIPIEKWKVESAKTIGEQLNRYLILK